MFMRTASRRHTPDHIGERPGHNPDRPLTGPPSIPEDPAVVAVRTARRVDLEVLPVGAAEPSEPGPAHCAYERVATRSVGDAMRSRPEAPPAIGLEPASGPVRVLPRVDVDRTTEAVRAQVVWSADDPAAVESRRVPGAHRLQVVGPVQLAAPAESVDAVHVPNRQVVSVDAAERTNGVPCYRAVHDQLATMPVAVVAPVVHPNQPQPTTADRASPVPAPADHGPPHALGDAHDPWRQASSLGARLPRQPDPGSRRMLR